MEDDLQTSPPDSPPPVTRPSQELVDNVNSLVFLVQHMTLSDDRPSASCGHLIFQLFLMAGCGGHQEDFYQVLGIDADEADEATQLIMDLDAYCKSDGGFDVSTTSSAWHHPEISPETVWPLELEIRLGLKVKPLDEEAVNDFVKAGTDGKMDRLQLAADSNLDDTKWMLLACFSFHAEWEEPFSTHDTIASLFYPFNDEPRICAIMRRTAVIDYYSNSRMQMCVLPFRNDGGDVGPRWKAAVILPRANGFTAFAEIQSNLGTSTALRSLLSTASGSRSSRGLRPVLIELCLPRFALRLGLDLSDTVESQNRDTTWARIHQTAVVDINEFGTDIPTVESAEPQRNYFGMVPRHVVAANRPFLYVIFDDVTKLVLCSAAICDPMTGIDVHTDNAAQDEDSDEEMMDIDDDDDDDDEEEREYPYGSEEWQYQQGYDRNYYRENHPGDNGYDIYDVSEDAMVWTEDVDYDRTAGLDTNGEAGQQDSYEHGFE